MHKRFLDDLYFIRYEVKQYVNQLKHNLKILIIAVVMRGLYASVYLLRLFDLEIKNLKFYKYNKSY